MKKVKIFKYVLLLSLFFIALYLYQSDVLFVPDIYSKEKLSLSFLVLGFSFLLYAFNWYHILNAQFTITFKDAVISAGLSVFAKYIPGKVLVIVGRASYIHEKYGYSQKELIAKSLDAQILSLMVGILFGSVSLVWLGKVNQWGVYSLISVFLFALFLFSPVVQRTIDMISMKILKKKMGISHLGIKETMKVLPSFLLYWITLSVAFYFFLSALSRLEVSILSGFAFPLAATFGIIALVAPGGIGVREGVLASLIHLGGVEIALATSIAIFSRLWFLIGESFLFILGFIVHSISRKRDKQSKEFGTK